MLFALLLCLFCIRLKKKVRRKRGRQVVLDKITQRRMPRDLRRHKECCDAFLLLCLASGKTDVRELGCLNNLCTLASALLLNLILLLPAMWNQLRLYQIICKYLRNLFHLEHNLICFFLLWLYVLLFFLSISCNFSETIWRIQSE